MKDAYTFDRDREGLDAHYERYREAYDRIFDRIGLEWYRVESDVGMMGGVGAHEYMAPSPAGENDVALAPGYAANVEVATADAQPVQLPDGLPEPRARGDAGAHDRRGGRAGAARPAGRAAEGLPGDRRGPRAGDGGRPRRPPRQRDQARQRARRVVPPRARGRVRRAGRAGRLHRPGRHRRPDPARRRGRAGRLRHRRQPRRTRTCVASSPAATSRSSAADVRSVEAGDTVNGHPIRIEPAIEVGNIFKLGTRYSKPFGATYLDEQGKAQPIWMGSYGLGPARIAAAAIEQFADEKGISWPRSIAPWDIHLVGLGKEGSEERARRREALRRARGDRPEDPLRRPRRRPGGEVRRRRAARRPGAGDGRTPHARGRRGRGAGPARP